MEFYEEILNMKTDFGEVGVEEDVLGVDQDEVSFSRRRREWWRNRLGENRSRNHLQVSIPTCAQIILVNSVLISHSNITTTVYSEPAS